MSTNTVSLTPHEALARELIIERVAARHHVSRTARRHTRTAVLLRRLAERLDPPTESHSQPLASRGPVRLAPSRHGIAAH